MAEHSLVAILCPEPVIISATGKGPGPRGKVSVPASLTPGRVLVGDFVLAVGGTRLYRHLWPLWRGSHRGSVVQSQRQRRRPFGSTGPAVCAPSGGMCPV